jgi:tetratricopeptide (TPR) repeat protein
MKLLVFICILSFLLLGSTFSSADTGSLYVTSNPSVASISLDNNPTGKKTESLLENIPTGTHKVSVEHTGYGKVEENIEIKSGLTTAVHLELQIQESKGTADYHTRGFASLSRGQYDSAVADFSKAIEQNPNFMVAHYNRGFAYFDLGKYDLAIADFTKAMKLGLKGKGAYYIRGLALCRAGQYDLAIEDFSRIIELDPADATVYNIRGVMYLLKSQYNQTVVDFTRALELDPKKAAHYYFCLGFVSDKMGDSDAARTSFLKARDTDKDIVRKQAELLETQVSRENKIFYGEAMLSAAKYLNTTPSMIAKAEEILKSTPSIPMSPASPQTFLQDIFSQRVLLLLTLALGGIVLLIVLIIKLTRKKKG